MLNRFVEFIYEKQLFTTQHKILLAVSGGIDSMVLLHLFDKSGFQFGVVHCNFNLRGNESDEDAHFVEKHILASGVPFFTTSFDTKNYAALSNISIEMAARELRYEYFENIRKENHYDYIATAHHADDVIETFFLNLSRKTGIKGLTGIKEKNGNIIRPLLFAGRKEIEKYASENYIDFREDSSNNETTFQRNFIRHKILPLFSELNPAFKKNALASIDNLKDAEKIYDTFLSFEKNDVVSENKNGTEISIGRLLKTTFPETLLYEILCEYNFNSAVAGQVFEGLDSGSGKQYFSKTHRVVKDRDKLFISAIKTKNDKIFYIEENDVELFEPLKIEIKKASADGFQISREKTVACIDADKVEFPLLIRKWKKGDYFQPLGMSGFKKVSDFFIDQKLPLHEKENTWLLCSGKNIVWIMGQRIDNRFKITSETRQVLKIEIRN